MAWYTLEHRPNGSVITCRLCGYNRRCLQCVYCGDCVVDDVLHSTPFDPKTPLLPRSKTRLVHIAGNPDAADNYIASRLDPKAMVRIRCSSTDTLLYTGGTRVPLGPLGRNTFYFTQVLAKRRQTVFHIVASAATPAVANNDMTVSASVPCPSQPYAALTGTTTHRTVLRWRVRRSLAYTVKWCMENPLFTGIVHIDDLTGGCATQPPPPL